MRKMRQEQRHNIAFSELSDANGKLDMTPGIKQAIEPTGLVQP